VSRSARVRIASKSLRKLIACVLEYSGMLRRVTVVRTDVSEEPSASIRVTRIGELGTTVAVTIAVCVGC
jgi:hypothetical protein